MGLYYLVAGFVFFFLPNFSIVDLLPDFIGCILIVIGLNKLSDLTPGLAEAKRKFVNVFYIHIIKFFLMFTVPYFGNTDGGYILIFSFTFAVLDLIFTLPAFKSLLNGFVYLGDRTNTKAIFKNQSEFSTLTSIFIFSKAILAMIPDLSYVSNPDYSGTVSSDKGFYISDYRNLLVAINFLITGIIGIIWLFYAIRYFKGIKNDKNLMSYLEEQYRTTVIPNKGLFIRRNIKTSFIFISVGAVFMLDLLIDLVNVIPDFFGAFFFLIAALILKKHCNTKAFTLLSGIFIITSSLSWAVLCIYSIKFPAVNIWSNIDAYELFVYVNGANILKYISLIPLTVEFFKLINNIIKDHTGSPLNELESVTRIRRQEQLQLKRTNILVLIFGLLCCASGIIRMILLYEYPEFSIFDFLFNIIYIIYLIKLLSSTKEAVEYRYL